MPQDWDLKGTIDKVRTADDGRVVSYDILTDRNHMTMRHQRYLKPLHEDHDPKAIKNDIDNANTANYAIKNADLPTAESIAPRRSSRSSRRISSRETVKAIRMGSDQSTPVTATIELKLGAEEDSVTICEVNTNGGNIRKELNNCDGRPHRSNCGVRALNPQQRSQGQAQDGQSDHRPHVGFRAQNSQQ